MKVTSSESKPENQEINKNHNRGIIQPLSKTEIIFSNKFKNDQNKLLNRDFKNNHREIYDNFHMQIVSSIEAPEKREGE